VAGKKRFRIHVGWVGLRWHSLDHPPAKLRHELEADFVHLSFIKLRVLLQNGDRVTGELYRLCLVVEVIEMILDLFSPVQIFGRNLPGLVGVVEVYELHDAELVVADGLLAVLVVGH
jgi:hypothetical protein